MTVSAGQVVLSGLASEIATRVAVQALRAAAAELGVKTAVLSSGGVSMVVTLGVGIVIAIIIDYVIDEIFRLAGYDPKANIAASIVATLDRMEAALLREPGWKRYFGDEKPGALRAEMERLHESRSRLRHEAVALTLKEGGMR